MVASTRAFSLSTWRARRRPGVGEALGRRRVGGAQVLDAELARGRLALGAALVVAARRRGRGRRRSRPSRAASRAGRAGRARSRAWRSRCAARGPPRPAARRAGRAARSRRRPSRSRPASRASPAPAGRAPRRPPTPSSARHSAVSSAAEEDRPAPRGTSPENADARRDQLDARRGELGDDAAREGAPALGAAGVGEREGVALAEVLATSSKRSPSSGSAVAVMPRSIANGSARPPL